MEFNDAMRIQSISARLIEVNSVNVQKIWDEAKNACLVWLTDWTQKK